MYFSRIFQNYDIQPVISVLINSVYQEKHLDRKIPKPAQVRSYFSKHAFVFLTASSKSGSRNS